MSLELIDWLNGVSSVIACTLIISIGITIISRYFKLKDSTYLYIGGGLIGLSEPWLPSGSSFLWNVFTGEGLPLEIYVIIGNVLIPFSLLFWLIGITELVPSKRKKIIRIVYAVIGALFEAIFFILLVIDPTLIGTFSAESAIVHIDIEYKTFILAYLFFVVASVLVSTILFARNSMKASDPVTQIRGKLILAAVLSWTIVAILDGFIPLNVVILPIIRVILAISAVLAYLGFTMPEKVKDIIAKRKKSGKNFNKYLPRVRFNNIPEMVLNTKNKFYNKAAIRWIQNSEKSVRSISYNELADVMISVFHALMQLGFKKGDHIGICSKSLPEWIFADLGVQSLGGVTVAIYPTLKPNEIKYILEDSECKAIFVDTKENMQKILSIMDNLPYLKLIIVFGSKKQLRVDGHIMSFEEVLSLGGSKYYPSNQFTSSILQIKEVDLASIIYTSGTTGNPKGVMLTHKNLLSDAVASVSVAMTLKKGIKPWKQHYFSVLPFAHSFGRLLVYSSLMMGSTIDIISETTPETIRMALEKFKPTVMAGIPYVFQKIYNTVLEIVKAEYPKKIRELVYKVINNGKIYYENKSRGKRNKLGTIIRHKLLGSIVGKRIRKNLDDKLLLMVSGSASISKELIYFFNTIGIPLIEGYGLTEASPVTHLMRDKPNSRFRPNFRKKVSAYKKIGSIGPPIAIPSNPYKNIEQKIDEDTGELLIKGPMVMRGYWKKPQATAKAIDEEGWLHTGDYATIDEDGYVYFTGRKKNIIKLSTGKMINPSSVENLIVPASNYIAQMILIGGDNRKYATAIIVPYQKALKEFADKSRIVYNNWRELINDKLIQEKLRSDIRDKLKGISDYKKPKRFLISSKAFLSEKYLTPTYKFKRNAIIEDFSAQINNLYNSDREFLIMEERMTEFYDQSMIIA
ncbi:MAG: putative Long-chain-fatty-acid--CoA ligase [Promethearchaeota archaeon]|nr:MAG: putative Long-chain-fatty-acid--CoA ligase [Candidatus Lokiarchaeota archaeon]